MKDKTASALIREYQRQENDIEYAEVAIQKATDEKTSLFAEILKREDLLKALLTTGVTDGDRLYKVHDSSSGCIEITPAPVADYSLDGTSNDPSPSPEQPF
jgi:hypothetical protein